MVFPIWVGDTRGVADFVAQVGQTKVGAIRERPDSPAQIDADRAVPIFFMLVLKLIVRSAILGLLVLALIALTADPRVQERTEAPPILLYTSETGPPGLVEQREVPATGYTSSADPGVTKAVALDEAEKVGPAAAVLKMVEEEAAAAVAVAGMETERATPSMEAETVPPRNKTPRGKRPKYHANRQATDRPPKSSKIRCAGPGCKCGQESPVSLTATREEVKQHHIKCHRDAVASLLAKSAKHKKRNALYRARQKQQREEFAPRAAEMNMTVEQYTLSIVLAKGVASANPTVRAPVQRNASWKVAKLLLKKKSTGEASR